MAAIVDHSTGKCNRKAARPVTRKSPPFRIRRTVRGLRWNEPKETILTPLLTLRARLWTADPAPRHPGWFCVKSDPSADGDCEKTHLLQLNLQRD